MRHAHVCDRAGGRHEVAAGVLGTLVRWHAPSGPGVRLDGGYDQGETVPGAFDSLVAKLIVTGHDRDHALARSRRALAEFVVDGMPTVIPFHAKVIEDPATKAPAVLEPTPAVEDTPQELAVETPTETVS